MFLGLLTLAFLSTPGSAPVSLSVPAVERPGWPAADCPSHATWDPRPVRPRRRCRDFLDDDDDSDGPAGSRAALAPPRELSRAVRTLLPHAGGARRLAAVPLVYALCTLLI